MTTSRGLALIVAIHFGSFFSNSFCRDIGKESIPPPAPIKLVYFVRSISSKRFVSFVKVLPNTISAKFPHNFLSSNAQLTGGEAVRVERNVRPING